MTNDNSVDNSELDQLQSAYKAAVEEWIAAIKEEEVLVAVTPHSVAEVDKWEGAHFKEDEIRNKVLDLKRDYEDALRERFFGFWSLAQGRFGTLTARPGLRRLSN